MKALDLTGRQFGYLTAIKRVNGRNRDGNGKLQKTKWLCRCKCGTEVEVFSCNLTRKTPNSTSCGCKFRESTKYNFSDLTGMVFGELTVIGRSPHMTETRGVLWECRCSCGKEMLVPSNSLTSGNKKTCLALSHKRSPRVGELPLGHINAIRQNAIKRNLEYSVEPDYLWELFLSQRRRCALSGVELVFTDANNAQTGRHETTASLDRIDSSAGYIPGNVRWLHKTINKMRMDSGDEEFLAWCGLCAHHAQTQQKEVAA